MYTNILNSKIKKPLLLSSLMLLFLFMTLLISSALARTASAAVQSISTGDRTTCSVVDGKARCWGDNSEGQLGIGTLWGTKNTPQNVHAKDAYTETVRECSGFKIGSWCSGSWTDKTIKHAATALGGKRVSKISVGKTHVCAIASAQAYCWGDNSKGQLGDRSNLRALVPVAVDVAPAVKKTCERYSTSGKTCLKYNVSADKPASALVRKEIIDITAGDEFTCALASDGSVACWGKNDYGQLGDGDRDNKNKNYPVEVDYNGRFKKLANVKGDVATMCAITIDNGALCWGDNSLGLVHSVNEGVSHGSGKGSARVSNGNRCGEVNRTAFNEAVREIPFGGSSSSGSGRGSSGSGRDVARPSQNAQRATGNYAELTIIGTGSVDIEAHPYLGSSGQYTYESTKYAYVTAKSTQGNAFWWGGAITQLATIDCYSNGETYYGERSESDVDVKRIMYQNGKLTPKGPLYTSEAAKELRNQNLALLAGTGRTGIHFTPYCHDFVESNGWFGSTKTTRVCELPTDANACATPSSNRSAVYCDDGSRTCVDNSNGSAIHIALLKAQGKYVQTCAPNGPKPMQSGGGSWLQPGMTLTHLDIGFSKHVCAAASNGTIGCWGTNNKGQLGVGDSRTKTIPTKTK